MRPQNTEAAIADAGLRIDRCMVLGSEWRDYYHEHTPARTVICCTPHGCCVILNGTSRGSASRTTTSNSATACGTSTA
jgi:hypothetical protein